MKGDFSDLTFDQRLNYSRVLMQQGHILLDSDWNEGFAILHHQLRNLTVDLLGYHAGVGDSLKVGLAPGRGENNQPNVKVLQGHYYVNGLQCISHSDLICSSRANEPLQPGRHLVYLDVWEDLVSPLLTRHAASVNGLNTPSLRSKVFFRVDIRAEDVDHPLTDAETVNRHWLDWVRDWWQTDERARLAARTAPPSGDSPVVSAEGYHGLENHLYRIEVHQADPPVFKWSRDNGTVIYPILHLRDNKAVIEQYEYDLSALAIGDWVELVDDHLKERAAAGPVARVTSIDEDSQVIALESGSSLSHTPEFLLHPFLRRWDQLLEVKEGKWLPLEHNIEVRLEPGGYYRTGDYWLIPARTSIQDIVWPTTHDTPEAVTPHGVEHFYAPLGIVTVLPDDNIVNQAADDCRYVIKPPVAPATTPQRKTARSIRDLLRRLLLG
jgi:hypothetical protein